MKAKEPQRAETYESLVCANRSVSIWYNSRLLLQMGKERKISDSIRKLEVELEEAQRKLSESEASSSAEVDPLDSFMMELKQSKPNKQSVNRLKSELIKLKQEHGNIIKLVNIAKPASLPPLVAQYASSSSGKSEKKSLPLFGKRKKIKLQLAKSESATVTQDGDEEDEDEEESTSVGDDEREERVPKPESKVEAKKKEGECASRDPSRAGTKVSF
jgi:hypothetical protein